MKEEKLYPIYVNWPGADKGSMVPFSYEVPQNGLMKTVTVYVKANEPVQVNKYIYDIWVDSIYNPNRKKSKELTEAEKKISGKGGNLGYIDYTITE